MTVFFWISLLSLPSLVLIYLFRQWYRPKTVSSLFLWDFPELRKNRGRKLKQFLSERSFWVELVLLCLLILLLMNLKEFQTDLKDHHVFILDDHFSLNAKSNQGAIYEKVQKKIHSSIQDNEGDYFSIILAAHNPKLLIGPSKDIFKVKDILEKWKPQSSHFDFEKSFDLALEVSGREGKVSLYTDRILSKDKTPPFINVLALGEKLSNRGFLKCSRKRYGSQEFLIIQGKQYGNFKKTRFKISMTLGSKKFDEFVTPLKNGYFKFEKKISNDPNELIAYLPDDELLEDNKIVLLPEEIKKIGVSFNFKDKNLLALFKKLMSSFDFLEKDQINPHIIFSDHFILNTNAWVFYIGNAFDTKKHFAKKDLNGYIIEKAHPFLKDLQFEGIVFSSNYKLEGEFFPIIHKESKVYLMELLSLPYKSYWLNTDIINGSFTEGFQWPVFWENVFVFRKEFIEGILSNNLIQGESNSIYLENPGENIVLKQAEFEIPLLRNKLIDIPELKSKGQYTILEDEKERFIFQINYCDQYCSDLSKCETKERLIKAKESSTKIDFKQEDDFSIISKFILLFVSLLLFIHLYLEAREGKR